MGKMFIVLAYFFILLIALPTVSGLAQSATQLSYGDIVNEIDELAIMKHVEELASFGSRVTGYPGYEKAAEYIYEEFSRLGLVNVAYDYFDVAVPIDYGGNITVRTATGMMKVINAYPLWPNLIQTSPTPPGGLTAKLVYVGKGLSELERKNVEGKVAFMEFNSRYEWKRVFAMGAKAVIFIESEGGVIREEAELKVTNIPLYAPRLYVLRDDGEFLKKLAQAGEVEVTIVSAMKYERVRAKNVVGYIPGTAIQEQVTAISAYYDSFSYVPSLSPGAQEALGISTLLELARFFVKHPPLRTLQFIAFAGHHQSLAGATEWTEKQFNDTITMNGNTLFRVQMIFSLDYSTEVSTIGVFPHDSFYPIGGSMYYQTNPPRNQWFHAVIFDKILPKMKNELGYDPTRVLPVADDPNRYGWEPIPRVVDSSALGVAGGIGFGLRTTGCLRSYEYVPSDTPDRVNLESLKPQLQFTYVSIYEAANTEEYIMHETTPERQHLTQWGFGTIEGQAVTYNYSSGWYDQLPNALIYLRTDPPTAQPERALFTDIYYWIGVADDEGKFTIHGVRPTSGFMMWYTIEVYKIDWTTGEITHAPDLGQYGDKTFSQRFYFERGWLGTKDHPRYFVAFPCSTIALHAIVDPTTFDASQLRIEVNSFFSHGSFLSWGSTQLGIQRGIARVTALPLTVGVTEALAFVPTESTAEILIRAGYYPYPVAVLVNASRENPRGVGYRLQLGEYLDLYGTPTQAASSLCLVTEDRLLTFTSMYTYSPTALDYYQKALGSFSKIDEATREEKYNTLYWESYNAWAYIINTYFATMDLTFEVLYSSVFFYVLLIPFVFLAERLLFPQTGRRRLLVIIILFSVFTGILYMLHPAFHIASNILMATIGFTVLVLACPLIIIMIGKLIGVINTLRRRLLGAHFVEISRASAALLSFSVGVENMRRRRLRTGLTLFTVVIVTFSLISFTSGSQIAITKGLTWQNVETPYSGFLIRDYPWKPLADELVTYAREEYGRGAAVAPRFWAYGPSQELPVLNLNTGRSLKVAGILGVTSAETEVTSMDQIILEGRFLEPLDEEGNLVCIISLFLAEKLEADLGDVLDIFGMRLAVVGTMDGSMLYDIVELDQEPITIRDILSPLPTGLQLVAKAGKEVPHVSGDLVILVPYQTARSRLMNMGGTYSIAVKFHDPTITISMAEEFSKRSRTILFASTGDGTVSLYIPRKGWAVSGLEIVAIPLFIGAFIILNTMLGAISERVREMGIFSSVGLSPMHVATMFLAESIVYGVLAGVIGYLLGMSVTNIIYPLNLMPPGLYPNFSSYMVILAVAIALVATVVSTLYPVYKASRLVTPTIERKWKPTTKPRGLEWNIPLPFSLSQEETPGLFAFMEEYFNAHSVERAGMFVATNVDTHVDEEGTWTLTARVRLEPFEVGIIQTIKLIGMPSRETKRNLFSLVTRREAGVEHTWRTSNLEFAGEIRRQLLLWTFLRSSEKAHYISEQAKYRREGS